METFGWGSHTNDNQYPDTLRGMNTTLVSCNGTDLEGDWGKEDISRPHFFCARASLNLGGPCYGDDGGMPCRL